ncbi:MAG: RHS domain-containing protein [Hahellaceae bacterium]|nr:RHS domain-containing protein [Hahellaceae bacterium]
MKRMFEMATRSSIQAPRRTVPALLVTLLTLVTLTAMAETRITYYHNDLLGSTTAATNEQGEILWQRAYYPFGEKFKNPAESSEDRLAYTGKLHNDDTGLTYMNARYYDPVVGRFAAMDPVGPLSGGTQHFNRYSYATNNPYRYTDPTGLGPVSTVGKAIATLVASEAKRELNNARRRGVARAWSQEKKAVKSGLPGLRKQDWTEAEKKELMETGKVRGYEGHHINSVEDRPDLADNPNNIEFVDRDTHFERHEFDWQNATSGPLHDLSQFGASVLGVLGISSVADAASFIERFSDALDPIGAGLGDDDMRPENNLTSNPDAHGLR